MSTASVELTLKFMQHLNHLNLATGAARLVCETIKTPDLPRGFADEVELAVSEGCTNAIQHAASNGASARVIVRFEVHETHLVVEISDQGAGFDLEKVREPEFEQHPEGGYGLYIIRKMMDEVQYARDGELNTLTMKKHFFKKGKLP
jgi:serine/threonine-protein kinase RsbW